MEGPAMTLSRTLSDLVHSEEGAASVEYGLLVAGIALAIFGSVLFLGQTVFNNFYKHAEDLIR